MADEDPCFISEGTARRLVEGLKDYEKDPLLPRKRPASSYRTNPGFAVKLAIATSSISAHSGSTLGSGSATLYKVNQSSPTTYSSLSTSITIYNAADVAIASGSLMIVIRIDGFWFAILWSC